MQWVDNVKIKFVKSDEEPMTKRSEVAKAVSR